MRRAEEVEMSLKTGRLVPKMPTPPKKNVILVFLNYTGLGRRRTPGEMIEMGVSHRPTPVKKKKILFLPGYDAKQPKLLSDPIGYGTDRHHNVEA